MLYNKVSQLAVLGTLGVFFANTAFAGLAEEKAASIYQGLNDQRQSIDTAASDAANGREKKANNAENTAAALTGGAMIGTGTPMIPSIIPSVSAAGAALVAKGVQELLQAAANKQASQANEAQKNLLLANVDGGVGGPRVDEDDLVRLDRLVAQTCEQSADVALLVQRANDH